MAESIKKYKQFENVEFSQHVFHIFHSHFLAFTLLNTFIPRLPFKSHNLCVKMMTCSYCTLVRMKIVVYLLPCNFLGSTVIKQRAPAQPSTSHLLILTSLQPYCVGLLSEHTCLAQPAPIKPFKVKTKGCVVVRKKQHLDSKEMSGINLHLFLG